MVKKNVDYNRALRRSNQIFHKSKIFVATEEKSWRQHESDHISKKLFVPNCFLCD